MNDQALVTDAERIVRCRELALRPEPGHELDHVVASEFFEAHQIRALLFDPVRKSSQCSAGLVDGIGTVEQLPLGDVSLQHRSDGLEVAHRANRFKPVPHRHLVHDSSVVERDAGLECVRVPHPGSSFFQRLGRQDGIDLWDLGDVVDDGPHRLDVVDGDLVDVANALVQQQAWDSPVDTLAVVGVAVPEINLPPKQRVDLAGERQPPHRVGDDPRLEYSDAQQPSPVELDAASQPEIDKVGGAGLVVDPASGVVEIVVGGSCGETALRRCAIRLALAAAVRTTTADRDRCRRTGFDSSTGIVAIRRFRRLLRCIDGILALAHGN